MDKETKTCGVTFTGLLTIAFVVLKLCGVITWSWWWVLAPFWMSIGIAILCVIAALIIERLG